MLSFWPGISGFMRRAKISFTKYLMPEAGPFPEAASGCQTIPLKEQNPAHRELPFSASLYTLLS